MINTPAMTEDHLATWIAQAKSHRDGSRVETVRVSDLRNLFTGKVLVDASEWARLTSAAPVAAEPYWWCAHCKETVEPTHVTYEEIHESCGRPVVGISPNEPCPDCHDAKEVKL